MTPESDAAARRDRGKARLSPVEGSLQLRPLRRAERLTTCFLYWIPATFPLHGAQRSWLSTFIERLSITLRERFGHRAEVFLQLKSIYPALSSAFANNAQELIPILGLGRRPGVDVPPVPSLNDLQPLMDGRTKFSMNDYVGDYCYWFLGKSETKERELFLGHGGLTYIFLPADPNAAPKFPFSPRLRQHPAFRDLFSKIDPERVMASGQALQDGFLQKSAELYKDDISDCPQTKGMPFIIPLLRSADFFNGPMESEKLFSLCDFYLNESVVDEGVLLASKANCEETLLGILSEMRDAGMEYSER